MVGCENKILTFVSAGFIFKISCLLESVDVRYESGSVCCTTGDGSMESYNVVKEEHGEKRQVFVNVRSRGDWMVEDRD